MSSPTPSDGDHQPKATDQLTFRFCRECSNMLYPKEDPDRRALMFACRTCQFSEPAQSSCVFVNRMNNTVGETAGVTQDVGSDPTVGPPDFCVLCGESISCDFCGEVYCSDLLVLGEVVKSEKRQNKHHTRGHSLEIMRMNIENPEPPSVGNFIANVNRHASATKVQPGVPQLS